MSSVDTIVFKSGAKVHFETDNLTATRNGHGELVKLAWENPKNKPLYLDLDSIAAVFVGKV